MAKADNCKQKAYEYIKKKIIDCELMPGDIIDQNSFIEILGISKTPIREAINTLETEGLVTILPRRGVLVSSISLDDVQHIYEARELLEPLVAEMAAKHADKEKLESYKARFQTKQSESGMTQMDVSFHQFVANATRNPYLIKVMDTLTVQNTRITVLGAKLPERLEQSNKEHIRIIDAMLARDGAAAKQAMIDHIASARAVAMKVGTVLM